MDICHTIAYDFLMYFKYSIILKFNIVKFSQWSVTYFIP